jgi:hypothetical protein
MIRQALGVSALRYLQNHKPDFSYQSRLTKELSDILVFLLPGLHEDEINKAATKFVSKAVKLKGALTEEQAVYRCYWVNQGEHLDRGSLEFVEGETGPVYMCTFPGLVRTEKEGKNNLTFQVVKASAMLQSAVPRR